MAAVNGFFSAEHVCHWVLRNDYIKLEGRKRQNNSKKKYIYNRQTTINTEIARKNKYVQQ